MQQAMAATLNRCVKDILNIRKQACSSDEAKLPR
jgi:hypothetical protein